MKNYNWKKGSLFVLACATVGFMLGGILKRVEGNMQVHTIVEFIQLMMPYLFVVAFISGSIGLGGYFYFKSKLKKDDYSNEENSFYERNEGLMSVLMMYSTLAAVINFTAIGMNLFNETSLGFLLVVNVVFSFCGEVGYISLIKKIRPELNADPLSTSFSRGYFDQLDE